MYSHPAGPPPESPLRTGPVESTVGRSAPRAAATGAPLLSNSRGAGVDRSAGAARRAAGNGRRDAYRQWWDGSAVSPSGRHAPSLPPSVSGVVRSRHVYCRVL